MGKKLESWLSLSPDTFKSRHAQLSVTVVIPGPAPVPVIASGAKQSIKPSKRYGLHSNDGGDRNDGSGHHVSTNPVLDPLAAESLWPWGRAR
jgi:hypothetical protein